MRIPLPSGASFASFTVCPAFAAPSSTLPSQPGTVMPPPAILRPVSSDAAAAGACAQPAPASALPITTTQIARLARRMAVLSSTGILCAIIAAIANPWHAGKSGAKQTPPSRVTIRYTLVKPNNLACTEPTLGTIYRSTRSHHLSRCRLCMLHQPSCDQMAYRRLGAEPAGHLRLPGDQVDLRPAYSPRSEE